MEENGRLIKFLYNEDREVVAEETGNGTITRYIRGLGIISSDSEEAKTYYHYVSDEQGSITHVLSEDADILNHYSYDAFGNIIEKTEKVENRFCYNGEMLDPVTQQYYLRARFYNPVIGRFTQEDIYYGDGLNLYQYCQANPVGYVDPSGHNCGTTQSRYNSDEKQHPKANAAGAYQSATEKDNSNGNKKTNFYVRPNGEVVTNSDYIKYKTVFDNEKYYDQNTGKVKWPGEYGDKNKDGYVNGERKKDVLKAGEEYERYGDNGNAHYYTKVGESLEARALPPGSEYKKTIKIVPLVDIECTSGKIAPWFDQPGYGTQYFTVETRDLLEQQGKIVVIH